LSATLSTGMTGVSLHMQWPLRLHSPMAPNPWFVKSYPEKKSRPNFWDYFSNFQQIETWLNFVQSGHPAATSKSILSRCESQQQSCTFCFEGGMHANSVTRHLFENTLPNFI
jgi:hypothetical protein